MKLSHGIPGTVDMRTVKLRIAANREKRVYSGIVKFIGIRV
jgi:hypothetical protein